MIIHLISSDPNVISTVKNFASNELHELTVSSSLQSARTDILAKDYDSVILDSSIRVSELISFATEITGLLAEKVVLLIGPFDPEQREQLSRRLSAHYSCDKPLRKTAFAETMRRVSMRSIIMRDVGLIGRSGIMEETVQTIMQIAPSPINILITGESGSGKEVIARAIHAISDRGNKPFIPVNCAALAEGVLESELFGHEKGSFTGAGSKRTGMFEKADNGTIFLDEIGEIPHHTQIRLLRVLEEREIMRVGGNEIIPVNVRVIAATNRNLEESVASGAFRRDLYYRIKVLEIKAPPLRKRAEDIPLLIDRLTRSYASFNNLAPRKFSTEAKTVLAMAPWHGNVRELRNFVESVQALTSVPVIGLADIPAHILDELNRPSSLPVPSDRTPEQMERELIYRTLLDIKNELAFIKHIILGRQMASQNGETPRELEIIPEEVDNDLSLHNIERQAIIDALTQHQGNRRLAAEMLGIGERTLYRKLKQYEIN